MEDVLAKIMKNASPMKHPNIRQSCSETQELLASQHELMRSPPNEVRSKCLETLQLALESKHSKLVSDSLNGFQRLIWDESFQSAFESNDEETWLPSQMLRAMASLPVQNDDIQVEMLKIMVQMSCTSGFSLTTKAVVHLISLCLDVYRNGIASVRTAAQATANQTLQTFCLMIQEPCESKEENCDDSEEINIINGIVEDIFPLLNFLCCKLKNNSGSEGKATTGLLLQCLLSILATLKVDIHENQKFLNFLWQELCPRLVALLGSPKTDKNIVSSQKSSSSEGNEIGRGSGCLATAPSCQSAEAKTIFSIAVQLVRLVGNIGSLRPVIESLYHRMLLYPPPQHRLEALKSTKEVFRRPELLLKFAGPPLYDTSDKNSRSEDLDLIRIAMDSLGECCHSSESSVCYASVSCAAELLKSLESICNGANMGDYTSEMNSLFATLESANYKGAKSERWLQTRNTAPMMPVEHSISSNLSSDYSDSELSEGAKSYTFAKGKPISEDEEKDENQERSTANGESEDASLSSDQPADASSDKDLEVAKEPAVEKSNSDIVENASVHSNETCSDSENHSSSTSTTMSGKAVDLDALEAFAEQERALAEKDRLNKVPQTLLGEEDAGKEERERIEKLCVARMEFAQQERENARKFVKVLCSFLPKLLSIRSSVEADLALQEFASNYCEELWRHQQVLSESSDDNVISQITILNADGIYLATYSALLLNLKLLRNNYDHATQLGEIPLTELQFVEEVHGSGVLVYLSATWLAELYQNVLAINLLEEAGYKPNSTGNSALVNLLSDVDGLGNSQPGGQQLADYSRLERAVANVQSTPDIEAGRKFSRRVMTSSWETILEVLSVLLNGTNSCGISSALGLLLGTEGAKEEHRKAKDAIAECLDGLQRAAKLCNALGLQSSCSAVFEQLAATSCPLSDDLTLQHSSSKKEGRHSSRRILLPNRNRLLRLHASHILSMDVILSRGLELGSHSPRCWKYVFQCCLYILELENTYFSGSCRTYSILAKPTFQVLKNVIDKKESTQNDSLDGLSTESYQETMPMPGSAIPQQLNISEIVKKNDRANSSGIIKDQTLLKVVEGLSQLVDRLFEEAASRLNLQALIGFLVELCAASHTQLFTESYRQLLPTPNQGNSLLLYHLGDMMLRCVRGGRPLIHIMKAWSVVAPHFVEAACHKDRMISKKAVEAIHDVVSALLSSNSELPHFHFNEALFKPFENLLCLELCDTDVQEQIISSICEFVEGCTTEIRSGWRPLFGALRAVRLPGVSLPVSSIESEREHVHHLRVVLDVFEAFLGTNNILVFAYAAVDCLLCLLKHVVGPAECQDSALEQTVPETTPISIDMCLAALKYLERCSSILASMYSMPTCPVFNSANRIQLRADPCLVDGIIAGLDIIYFDEHVPADECKDDESAEIDERNFSYHSMNAINKLKGEVISLKTLDRHTGVLHVWFLLLEGLAGTIRSCPRRCQPHTMETFFNMLRSIKAIPGPSFGVYCINHLLLPMLQGWLRRTARTEKGWSSFTANFKQCCGLTTDLVVEYVQYISENESADTAGKSGLGMNLMLEQLFVILIECIAQPSETVSRLGCACIRHVVISAGKHFTSSRWDIVCRNLQQACYISLYSVKQLMVCFHADSDNFYGDLGEVKVAARKDSSPQESERLKQLARQVFLLDCQRGSRCRMSNCTEEEDRSFIFLLHPPNSELDPENLEQSIIRVPFRNLVVGLLSHQILLQILCSILLQGSQHMLPTIMTLLSFLSAESVCVGEILPGFLSKLTSKQLNMLFSCLTDSYRVACDFDSRPGLKFLIQKVAQMDVAANLYKQTGVSWTTHCLALFELCFSNYDLSLDNVNGILDEESAFDLSDRTASPEGSREGSDHVQLPDSSSETKQQRDFNLFISLLRKFKDLSELYTECSMDKDGLLATVDRMTDQPIFFLIAQPDNINDITERRFEDSSGSRSDREAQKYETATLNSCDSSDSEDLVIEDSKDKVYSLATERTISSLISEYKRRKTQHSMPSTFREKFQRKSSSSEKRKRGLSDASNKSCQNSVPEEIIMQRRASITKDGEAHVQVFKQLVQAVLELHLSLSDKQFKSFLPVLFPGVQYLVAYATDTELKLTVAEWLQRLAVCCGFSRRTRSPTTEQ